MNNRYYIVKMKSSAFGDKYVYGFKDLYSDDKNGDYFELDGTILLIENPSDAISVCTLLNSNIK